jgi:hypothetical protein
MPDRSYELGGVHLLEYATEGPQLQHSRDATDLIARALQQRIPWVVIPVARLGDDFFRLRTGVAGDFIQKFVNYRIHLAIVGDISRYVDESTALRDFVREANRGNQVLFMATVDELGPRLKQLG